MPSSVPEGLRLELTRARLLDGMDAEFEEWIKLLIDRYGECVYTLSAEWAVLKRPSGTLMPTNRFGCIT